MKPTFYLIASVVLLSSCKKEVEVSRPDTFQEIKSGSFSESDFSAWMTKAEQQVAHDKKPEGHYYAYVEGRSNGGLNQYRHVQREFPADRYDRWSVYWGLNTEEFYQVELRLLREGYTRENLQVFVDSNGTAMHQAVWLRQKAAP